MFVGGGWSVIGARDAVVAGTTSSEGDIAEPKQLFSTLDIVSF
jgi:hypothetical protein